MNTLPIFESERGNAISQGVQQAVKQCSEEVSIWEMRVQDNDKLVNFAQILTKRIEKLHNFSNEEEIFQS